MNGILDLRGKDEWCAGFQRTGRGKFAKLKATLFLTAFSLGPFRMTIHKKLNIWILRKISCRMHMCASHIYSSTEYTLLLL